MTSKYIPQSVKPRSWDEIEAHYIDLNNHGWKHDRLLELVRHIKSSGLQDRLFASTSLDKLIVSIYDPIEWNRETLHIEFDRQNQKWDFKYLSRPLQNPEYVRQYDPESGIEKFDKFISFIKW